MNCEAGRVAIARGSARKVRASSMEKAASAISSSSVGVGRGDAPAEVAGDRAAGEDLVEVGERIRATTPQSSPNP